MRADLYSASCNNVVTHSSSKEGTILLLQDAGGSLGARKWRNQRRNIVAHMGFTRYRLSAALATVFVLTVAAYARFSPKEHRSMAEDDDPQIRGSTPALQIVCPRLRRVRCE